MSDEIPNLTLRVLQNIQTELVGMRAEMGGMRAEMGGMRAEMTGMRADMNTGFDTLNTRFDHFLSFAGRDVQDLKLRVAVVEQHLGIKPT